MVRRAVNLPDAVDARVRGAAEEGESYSAAVTRLLELALASAGSTPPPPWIAAGEARAIWGGAPRRTCAIRCAPGEGRRRHRPARLFLGATAAGWHPVVYLTATVLRRAMANEAFFASIDLGFVDACVMAEAERRQLPVLTFDFEDFRATRPAQGAWELVVDEARYREATS